MCTWREPQGPEFRGAGAGHPEGFVELGSMDQTPIQDEMPVEITLEKRAAKDARVSAEEVRGNIGTAARLRLLKLCTIAHTYLTAVFWVPATLPLCDVSPDRNYGVFLIGCFSVPVRGFLFSRAFRGSGRQVKPHGSG